MHGQILKRDTFLRCSSTENKVSFISRPNPFRPRRHCSTPAIQPPLLRSLVLTCLARAGPSRDIHKKSWARRNSVLAPKVQATCWVVPGRQI